MTQQPSSKALRLVEQQGLWIFEPIETEAVAVAEQVTFVTQSFSEIGVAPDCSAEAPIHFRIVAVLNAMAEAAGRTSKTSAEREFLSKCAEYSAYLSGKLTEQGLTLPSITNGLSSPSLPSGWREETAVAVSEILGHLANHIKEILVPARLLRDPGARNDSLLLFVSSADDSAKPRRYMYVGNETAIVEMHDGFSLFLDLADLSLVPTLLQTGWWEPWIEQVVKSCLSAGNSFVNAGANFGYHACHGAKLVEHTGKAFLFEANPAVFAHLRRSVFYNGFADRSSLFNAAVWDAPGSLPFHACREQVGGGRLARLQQPRKPDAALLAGEYAFTYDVNDFEHFDAVSVTLDSTVGQRLEALDLLQMDIEGSEGGAILGGRELIHRSRELRLILEWSIHGRVDEALQQQHRDAVAFLKEDGFNFYRIEAPRGNVFSTPPNLNRVDVQDLMALPHSDLFITR